MQTVLPREEAVEAIFSEILASPTACEQLRDVFFEHLDEEHGIDFDESEHFVQVLFNAYKNGDVSAEIFWKEKERGFQDESMKNLKKSMTGTNVHHVPNYIWQMDMILCVLIHKEWSS